MPPIPEKTPAPIPFEEALEVAALSREGPTAIARRLDDEERAALARFLGIPAVSELAFAGRILPWGPAGWRGEGRLEGRVTQSCVVTLEPVEEALTS